MAESNKRRRWRRLISRFEQGDVGVPAQRGHDYRTEPRTTRAGVASAGRFMKTHTLRPSRELTCIYLYRDPVDFRKSYRGLSVLIELELGHSPFSGELYFFINRDRSRIKGLFWEDTGFVLYYKALAEERFHWPTVHDDTLVIDGEQLNWLFDGFDLDAMRPHRALAYESVA